MKRKVLIFAAILAIALSCSDKFEVGHEVDSSLYLLNPGKQEITISYDDASYDMYVCKGGLNDDVFAVSLTVDSEDLVVYNAKYMSSFMILPPNSYEFERVNMLVGKDDGKTAVRVSFIYDCLPEGTAVLPVRLVCTSSSSVTINEEYSVAYLFVTKK